MNENNSGPMLSVQQNIARGIYNIAPGTQTSTSVTTTTLIVAGGGMLVEISILAAGTTTGYVHNSATAIGVTDANKLMALPTMLGVQTTKLNFVDGLVVVPGTGQRINVTYSLIQRVTGA